MEKQNCTCQTAVSCEVGSCVYNRDKKTCTAPSIKVGPQFASSTAVTNCSTFKAR